MEWKSKSYSTLNKTKIEGNERWRLHEQLEIQRNLQLRIEEQKKIAAEKQSNSQGHCQNSTQHSRVNSNTMQIRPHRANWEFQTQLDNRLAGAGFMAELSQLARQKTIAKQTRQENKEILIVQILHYLNLAGQKNKCYFNPNN